MQHSNAASDRAAAQQPDPRAKKQRTVAFRRELIATIRERCGSRRCWWTWPFGHSFEPGRHFVTTAPSDKVSRCQHCGVPYTFDSFSVYDLIRFMEDKLDVPDEVTEPLFDRWREDGAKF